MQLMDLIKAAGGIGAIAQQVGVSESQAQAGAAALLPAIVGGFQKQAASGGGLAGLASMLASAGGAQLVENVVGPSPTNEGLGNQLLGQLFGSKDVSRAVATQAAGASGLGADTLKKMLPLLAMVAAGMMAKQTAGSSTASGAGGLLEGLLSGGNTAALGGLGKLLDANGDGNPLDDVLGMAGKLFGR